MSCPLILSRHICGRKQVNCFITISKTFATHAFSSVNLNTSKDRSITPPYDKLLTRLDVARKLLNGRPLTLSEKILYSHLYHDPDTEEGSEFMKQDYLQLRPQRVAMQDASAQYAFHLYI